MLYRNKKGEYISDYLLDGERIQEMEDNFNKAKKRGRVFDDYDLDDEDIDFYACGVCPPCVTPAVWGENKEKDIDNFVDKLFERDPFEYADEKEENTGFDPDVLEDTDFDTAYEKIKQEEEANKKNIEIISLEDLREITKHAVEKFLNKYR